MIAVIVAFMPDERRFSLMAGHDDTGAELRRGEAAFSIAFKRCAMGGASRSDCPARRAY